MYPRASPTETALHVSKSDLIRFVLEHGRAIGKPRALSLLAVIGRQRVAGHEASPLEPVATSVGHAT